MKKIFTLIFAIILAYSCSTSSDSNNNNSSLVNVNWEIIASSNVRTDYFPNNNSITIEYTNSAGQQQIETTNYPNDFITWNKTFNLTNTNRPLNLSLKMTKQSQFPWDFYILNGGTIKFNLYLDGILTKSVTESSSSSGAGWKEIGVVSNFAYTLQ